MPILVPVKPILVPMGADISAVPIAVQGFGWAKATELVMLGKLATTGPGGWVAAQGLGGDPLA